MSCEGEAILVPSSSKGGENHEERGSEGSSERRLRAGEEDGASVIRGASMKEGLTGDLADRTRSMYETVRTLRRPSRQAEEARERATSKHRTVGERLDDHSSRRSVETVLLAYIITGASILRYGKACISRLNSLSPSSLKTPCVSASKPLTLLLGIR